MGPNYTKIAGGGGGVSGGGGGVSGGGGSAGVSEFILL